MAYYLWTINMSGKTIGKNFNTNDVANTSTFSVGSTAAVTLLPAQVENDTIFIEVLITNDGNKSLWVRKRPASLDNLKNGRRIAPGDTKNVVENSNNYTGEISAIFDSGAPHDVHVEVF